MASVRSPLEAMQRLRREGTLARAAEVYAKHVEAHPDDARALLRLAELRERMGELREAASVFAQLGRLNAQQGFEARAIAALRQAHRLAPEDTGVCRDLVQRLRAAGRSADAVDVLEAAARHAAARGDLEDRRWMLEALCELDESGPASMALAELLAQQGDWSAAARRLRQVLGRLDEERRPQERLGVLERLLRMEPEDRASATAAARLALEMGEPRRALEAVRLALDTAPEDPELYALAARGLGALGEKARALLVHREAARGFAADGRLGKAREEWLAVLAWDPGDEEARGSVVPSLVPDVVGLLSRREELLEGIGESEAETALALLGTSMPGPMQAQPADEYLMEVSPEDVSGPWVLEADPDPLSRMTPPPLTGAPTEAGVHSGDDGETVFSLPADLGLELELDVPGGRVGRGAAPSQWVLEPEARGEAEAVLEAPEGEASAPRRESPAVEPVLPEETDLLDGLPGRTAPLDGLALQEEVAPEQEAAPEVAPLPRRALVMGAGPEAGWMRRALEDAGVEALRVGPEEFAQAAEAAQQTGCELVVAPASLAEAVRACGNWRVLSFPVVGRGPARDTLRARELPVLEGVPVRSLEELRQALSQREGAVELVGPSGAPVRVSNAATAAFPLEVARGRHGSELLAQPSVEERARVVVASDGRRALGLAEWRDALVEGRAVVESPAGPGEDERLALAGRMVRALGLQGVTVVVLVRHGGAWCFESLEGELGPGALAVEARTALTLTHLALGLVRGERLEEAPGRRGHALAVMLPRLEPSAVAGLRLEPAEEGAAVFICAHASEREAAVRKLTRALKPAGT